MTGIIGSICGALRHASDRFHRAAVRWRTLRRTDPISGEERPPGPGNRSPERRQKPFCELIPGRSKSMATTAPAAAGVAPAPATPEEQRRFYSENGYVLVKGVLPREECAARRQ